MTGPGRKEDCLLIVGPGQALAVMAAVVWNPLDSNLNAVLSADQLTATPLLSGPLARMWCGLRASAGLRASKAAFTVHLQTNPALLGKAAPQYLCMIGVSTQETDICQLGEAAGSWGYGSPGRKSSAGVFAQYGRTFGPGIALQDQQH